ncbi:MAG: acyl-ACP--UDP-N-acetylglucosamine O-acyltransferase [candidate division Zixibacteria bacterium]|jgi:UDP-N-acetylglucosamine acyltransferase|nr:acyl-ACP--UDP-N-acetylglucosamine O-acyltransferase [candidate division Zixibacteria bacterium]
MSDIHPSAIVSKKAEIADDVVIGPHSIVEDDVVVGRGCRIASSVLLASGARLGERVQVSHSAVIGTRPQDLKFGGEVTRAIIGDDTAIREFVTINRGTAAHGETSIGKNCFVMAYAHVAHDCIIGNNVIMANSVNLAGHIEIDDYAILGGVLPVHQFVKIGAHCMIGGGFRVQQDVCPYALVGGYPLKTVGINSIGLRRRGFPKETIATLEKTFKILFFSNLNTSQAVERIKSELEILPEVQTILDFIDRSNRGIVK